MLTSMQTINVFCEMQCNPLPNSFDLWKRKAYFALSSQQHRIAHFCHGITAAAFQLNAIKSPRLFSVSAHFMPPWLTIEKLRATAYLFDLRGFPAIFQLHTNIHDLMVFVFALTKRKMEHCRESAWENDRKSACNLPVWSIYIPKCIENIANGLFNIIPWQWNPI